MSDLERSYRQACAIRTLHEEETEVLAALGAALKRDDAEAAERLHQEAERLNRAYRTLSDDLIEQREGYMATYRSGLNTIAVSAFAGLRH